MPAGLTYDVCWGLSILQREVLRRVLERPLPEETRTKYSDTLFPVFPFLTGFRSLSPTQSLFAIGLGVTRNVLVGKPVTSVGSLQSIGLAALLLHAFKAAQPGPLLSVGCLYLVARYIVAAGNQSAQKEPREAKKHDIRESMGVATTAATMWVGHCVAKGYFSSNELFVTGVSLISFGHLSSYAFPKLFSTTAARWSPSSALIANGISLLNYTGTTLGCRLLLHYDVGTSALTVLGIVGSHALELFFLSAAFEACRFPQFLQRRIPGLKGAVATAFITNAILIGAALALDHLKITDRFHLPFA